MQNFYTTLQTTNSTQLYTTVNNFTTMLYFRHLLQTATKLYISLQNLTKYNTLQQKLYNPLHNLKNQLQNLTQLIDT